MNKLGYKDSIFTQDKTPSFSVTGKYYATLCKIEQLDFCGLKFPKPTVKVWNPPSGHHADGIVGMSLLKYFNISIDMDIQRAIIERSQATNDLLHKNKA